MKTGYFYNLRHNEIKGAISIAIGKPRYIKLEKEIKELAPTWGLLQDFRNNKINEAQYIERFNKQLSRLDPADIYERIKILAGDNEAVIMCHCNKQSFCHRHLVAEWLEKELDIKIEEYGIGAIIRQDGRII